MMETEHPNISTSGFANWKTLLNFEVYPVMSSTAGLRKRFHRAYERRREQIVGRERNQRACHRQLVRNVVDPPPRQLTVRRLTEFMRYNFHSWLITFQSLKSNFGSGSKESHRSPSHLQACITTKSDPPRWTAAKISLKCDSVCTTAATHRTETVT